MLTAVCVLLWSLSWISASVVVGQGASCPEGAAELRPPQDVAIVSLNTNYWLNWSWTSLPSDWCSVTFTTQFLSKYEHKNQKKKKSVSWRTACEGRSERSCDLTHLGLLYEGRYVFRVRAELRRNHSGWVETEFCPDIDAELGPPSRVDLNPAGSDLDVVISDPLSSNNTSMKEHAPRLYYQILYWEHWEHSTAPQRWMIDSSINMVTLPNLKAWTRYCVSVRTRDDYYNKSSSFTPPRCLQTEGAPPWWLVCVSFLSSLLLGFLLVLLSLCCLYWSYWKTKTCFYPPDQLPTALKESLFDSPGFDRPCLLNPDSDLESLCEHVLVCSLPSEDSPDNSGGHCRHDSSSSDDSGVHSATGSAHPPLTTASSDGPAPPPPDSGSSHPPPPTASTHRAALPPATPPGDSGVHAATSSAHPQPSTASTHRLPPPQAPPPGDSGLPSATGSSHPLPPTASTQLQTDRPRPQPRPHPQAVKLQDIWSRTIISDQEIMDMCV